MLVYIAVVIGASGVSHLDGLGVLVFFADIFGSLPAHKCTYLSFLFPMILQQMSPSNPRESKTLSSGCTNSTHIIISIYYVLNVQT